MINLQLGDCLDVLKTLADNSVDSVVTDPPYGLSFMGKHWDYDVPGSDVWAECLRVLKPGGHLLAFAGTRTQHRMAVNIEDAGFEIRDMIAWVYGSGFPKSLDVSKAIDKAAGAEREMVRVKPRAETSGTMAGSTDTRPWIEKSRELGYHEVAGKDPVTAAAAAWQGFGTALKPALEPVTVARKPLVGTVAANVLAHGCGALNIDASRIPTDPSVDDPRLGGAGTWSSDKMKYRGGYAGERFSSSALGRWPANLIHDGSDDVAREFPDGNARFFYQAKTSKKDRGDGNSHPTVKPTDLMRYLCRLVTPPGGIVLDPFMGSGSTGKAAVLEGFRFIGIEREPAYMDIATARIDAALVAELW